MPEFPYVRSLTCLALAGLACAGCAHQATHHQRDLDVLKVALPGIYANVASTSDPNGAPELALSIVPVVAQAIGDPALFVRETAAGNEHLVLAQRIWVLALDPHGRIILRMYSLKDARRWVGAAEQLDLLMSLLPSDLQPLPGCDLVWQKTASGFETEEALQGCRPGVALQGQWVLRHGLLGGRQLSLTERQIGPNGALLPTSDPSSSLLFHRATESGGEPQSGEPH